MTEHPNREAGSGLWLTITELAAHKGLGKPAISERVARLERSGQITTKPGAGRSKLINLAEFDRVVGETTDLAREQGAATKRQAVRPSSSPDRGEGGPVYTQEQARRMAYQADLSELELAERRGKILAVDDVRQATMRAAETIVRVIDQLPQEADDLAAALAKDGVHGVRVALKALAGRLRGDIVSALAAASPAPPIEEGGPAAA